jgi:hypothetical protein
MNYTTILATLCLAGCGTMTGGNFEYLSGTPAYQECAYQAKSSTPPTNNPFSDVMREQELKNMCLKSKGYASK